jgi:hypothetical protein
MTFGQAFIAWLVASFVLASLPLVLPIIIPWAQASFRTAVFRLRYRSGRPRRLP